MANIENLIPLNKRSKEDAKKIQEMGAKAANEAKVKKKTMKEAFQMVLEMRPPDKITNNKGDKHYQIVSKIKEMFPDISDVEITNRLALVYMVYRKCLLGDMRAIEIFRDTAGEKPTDKTENNSTVKLKIDRKEVKDYADELRKNL